MTPGKFPTFCRIPVRRLKTELFPVFGFPRSLDEEEVSKVLKDKNNTDYPDLIMAVIDASRIENNLFLFTQLYDLGLPMVLVLNMWDLAKKQGVQIDLEKLQDCFPDITIISTNARVGIGKERMILNT